MSFVEFNKNIATKTAVVFPDVYGQGVSLSAEARLREAIGLAIAIDLDVVYKEIVNVRNVKPATLIGQGVIDRLKDVIELTYVMINKIFEKQFQNIVDIGKIMLGVSG